MTKFVKACIDYGFEELNLNRIVIKCAEGNLKSANIPKRLGFTQAEKPEGKRVRNNEEHDTIVFTLDKESWCN